jgi:transcription antitermination factor NusG
MGKKSNRRQSKGQKANVKAAFSNEYSETTMLNPAPDGLDLGDQTKWFLVYTSPRAEAKAVEGLTKAGCQTFWPSSHRKIMKGKRVLFDGDVGTFPRYLFVSGMPFRQRQIDSVMDDRSVVTINGRPIDDIRDVDGVRDVVGTSRGWLRVPVAAIRAIAGYQNAIEPVAPALSLRFSPGEQTTVISGPFASFQATVVEAIGLDQAKVLIDIFGGTVPVTLSIAQLDAA